MNNNNASGGSRLKTLLEMGLPQLLVIMCGILFFFFVFKIHVILSFFGKVLSILTPIIMGLAMAYLLNPVMVFFERRFLKAFETSIKTDKKRRVFGTII